MDNPGIFNRYYKAACTLTDGLLFLDGPMPKISWYKKWKLRRDLKNYDAALRIFPSSWQLQFFKGKIHQILGENMLAIKCFIDAIANGSNNYDIQRELSYQYMLEGNGSFAVKYAEMAVCMDSNNAGLLCNLGLAKLINRNVIGAIRDLEKACELEMHPVNMTTLALAKDIHAGRRAPIIKLKPGGAL